MQLFLRNNGCQEADMDRINDRSRDADSEESGKGSSNSENDSSNDSSNDSNTVGADEPNPPRTTTGKFTMPKFGSAGSGGAELEPGPELA
ncbi:MAG: hypothetical protein ACR2M1_02340 [Gemmatimonadaceae bacterium]